MKTEYQIIAVDFDGTLCTDCFPKIGQPNTALIELLKGLRRQGRQIILWTCRCGNQLEEAVECPYGIIKTNGKNQCFQGFQRLSLPIQFLFQP